jgi:hypothetical protein
MRRKLAEMAAHQLITVFFGDLSSESVADRLAGLEPVVFSLYQQIVVVKNSYVEWGGKTVPRFNKL